MQEMGTTPGSRRQYAEALLQAGRILASAGRPASAAVLRQGLDLERFLLAVAGNAPRIDTTARPSSSEVRVAAILDEFSANSFGSTFKGTALSPDRWQEQFEEARPQIFFCESAWSGADSRMRPWKGRIYASKNFKKENRDALLDILIYCRKEGIPTVFWNKEDPTHYTDRVHDFVKTATQFDHVFTTAAECVSLYKSDYGLKSVHALPFATNPTLFNPIEIAPRLDVITFAGSWYANHTERSQNMHRILRGLRESGYGLEIYDRFYDDSDPLHRWPEDYAPFLRSGVPHDQVAAIYKRGHFGLNINTVTQSRTMFARRVFELMSSNTLVLTNHSVGMQELFGQDVVFCDREPERLARLRPDEISTMRERNLNRVLSNHTYRNRWEEILRIVGFRFRPAAEAITVVWPIRNQGDAQAGLTWFQQEASLSFDRLLLLALEALPPLDTASLYESFNRFGVTVTSLRHVDALTVGGYYAPIETNHMLLVAPDNPPAPSWLARARLHLQYAKNTPIIVAPSANKAYQLVDWAYSSSVLLDTGAHSIPKSSQALAV